MKYTVRLRRNSDGEERVYFTEFPHAAETLAFYWTEGNFGCDCNRELAFAWAAGIDTDDMDVECWPEGRFTVMELVTEDGRVLVRDDEDLAWAVGK